MDRNPLSDLSALVSVYAAEEFLAQRKRLREARMRWIDEHEAPRPYQLHTKDSEGNETTFTTPFEVGQLQYPEEYNDSWKEEGQRLADPAAEKLLLEGIEAIIDESISSDKQLTILVSGSEQHAFLTGGDQESPHPPMMEGEDYAEYYARVAREYEQAAGESGRSGTGRSGAGADDLWKPAPGHPAAVRRADVPGDGTARDTGAMLGDNTDALRPDDQGPDPAGRGNVAAGTAGVHTVPVSPGPAAGFPGPAEGLPE